jgi:hypothetical protein
MTDAATDPNADEPAAQNREVEAETDAAIADAPDRAERSDPSDAPVAPLTTDEEAQVDESVVNPETS